MAKPDTTLKAFEREVKRLSKLLKSAEAKGITFLTSPIPPKPKRVTEKSVERLRKITAPKLLSKGYTVDEETGELSPYKLEPKSPRSDVFTEPETPLGIRKSLSKSNESSGSSRVPKAKRKLTPEELKRIRSQAAKKAAATRARREREDPIYRARMQEIRRKALAKGRETMKRKAEQSAQYKQHLKDVRSSAAEKAAETRAQQELEDPRLKAQRYFQRVLNLWKGRKKKHPDIAPPTWYFDWDKIREETGWTDEEIREYLKELNRLEDVFVAEHPEYYKTETPVTPPKTETPAVPTVPEIPEDTSNLPNEADLILTQVEQIISSGQNKFVCEFLMSVLIDEIDFYGREEVAERCNKSAIFIIECAQIASFDSDSEDVAQNAYAVMDMILGGNAPHYLADSLSEALDEDFPYRHRRNNRGL